MIVLIQAVLRLYGKRAMSQAQALLDQAVKAARDRFVFAPVNIQVCGLAYMNDDPSAVNVLYAQLQATRYACMHAQ